MVSKNVRRGETGIRGLKEKSRSMPNTMFTAWTVCRIHNIIVEEIRMLSKLKYEYSIVYCVLYSVNGNGLMRANIWLFRFVCLLTFGYDAL